MPEPTGSIAGTVTVVEPDVIRISEAVVVATTAEVVAVTGSPEAP